MRTTSEREKSAADVRAPSPEALHIATSANRLAKKDAPVRNRFFIREQVNEPDPPLARILRGARGGRGGDVRFRLYLSMLWLVRDDPVLMYPARSWAALLGLDEPETKGARRIKDALVWLDEHDFVHLGRAVGNNSEVELRDDAGTGGPYELPGAVVTRLKRKNDPSAKAHLYTRIPNGLWTCGWMSILSGSAVAMLTVLLYESERSSTSDVWLSPSLADLRYGLSEDTRGKGLLQLEQGGLVQVRRRSIASEDFDFRKVRNVYTLRTRILTDGPAQLRIGTTRSELRLGKPAHDESLDEVTFDPTPAGSPRRRRSQSSPGHRSPRAQADPV